MDYVYSESPDFMAGVGNEHIRSYPSNVRAKPIRRPLIPFSIISDAL